MHSLLSLHQVPIKPGAFADNVFSHKFALGFPVDQSPLRELQNIATSVGFGNNAVAEPSWHDFVQDSAQFGLFTLRCAARAGLFPNPYESVCFQVTQPMVGDAAAFFDPTVVADCRNDQLDNHERLRRLFLAETVPTWMWLRRRVSAN